MRKSLEPPYAGPYKVLSRTEKVFTVETDGKPTTVSIDRLKAAHLDEFPSSRAKEPWINTIISAESQEKVGASRRTSEGYGTSSLCHGAAAWGHNMTSRLQKKLDSIQRLFLLYITDAYRTTTPTAALQVVTGLQPLHLQIQQEATYA
ncbi:hypothetical protein AVEN_230509-1 [Araneus ventricosus]|uniref:Uncharacterized protein n=1 Tax=Araneus ventricosus TaxID=182803 RepID=A0A4Y2KSK7_ARAVE|nr:hypothetical protein AVEN_230509-1 [Araneus ventricosus]